MQLQIQPLSKDYLEETVKLDRACFGGLWTKGAYEREIDSPNSLLLAVLIQENDSATEKLIGIGCFWAIVEEAHLTLLGIDPDYRRKGLGELLLCQLLEKAIEWSLERATLEVRVSNESAIALYEKLGFAVAGRRKDYYPIPPEDALILWHSKLDDEKLKEKLQKLQQKRATILITKGWQIMPS